ncbi:MAG: 4Fe-4S dicluster domain-containing protein [Planctomycetia bacterium]|nr:4Fe-4S dicluster domain-containing protein [Planctomycetia bacterium]
MEQQLRETAKKLLTEKTVDVVIGYGRVESGQIGAIFVSNPDEVERLVWNQECRQNLVVYLTRKEVQKLGKAAIVVKGCDAKAIVVLANESQIKRDELVVIGMICNGIIEESQRTNGNPWADSNDSSNKLPIYEKCETCVEHQPKNVDIVIGDPAAANPDTLSKAERDQKGKYAKLAKLKAMTQEERFAYWKKEFSRCVKCYACRQNCPLCYCNQCVVDKNRPIRIDTSATLKGNFAWNILRAFHLAGRCVGCGACSSACPAGIDLDLLNLSLSIAAEDNFNFVSGKELGTAPLIGTFSENDREDFIR